MPLSLRSLHVSLVAAAICLVSTTTTRPLRAAEKTAVVLWPDGAPGALGAEDKDTPTLTPYVLESGKANGTAVVICPGGGYGALATDHEGHQIAQWFNKIGVTAFVLKYRLGPRYHHPIPLGDVQRAIRWIRHKKGDFGVSGSRIGVMGFSAGGHLASTVATHFDRGDAGAADEIDKESCRPDFAILGYAVISFSEPFSHVGSRNNLLGTDPDPKLVELLSNEKQVTKETPPTFLFHTAEDAGVPPDNSLVFFQALRKAGVPAELHVYQFGPHGVGLAFGDPVVSTWNDRLRDWLLTSGFLADVERAEVEGSISVAGKPLRWGCVTFIPVGDANKPAAWAMIGNGNYTIPKGRGAVVGECRVEIRDMGAIEPRVTIPEVRILNRDLKATIVSGKNIFKFDLP